MSFKGNNNSQKAPQYHTVAVLYKKETQYGTFWSSTPSEEFADHRFKIVKSEPGKGYDFKLMISNEPMPSQPQQGEGGSEGGFKPKANKPSYDDNKGGGNSGGGGSRFGGKY